MVVLRGSGSVGPDVFLENIARSFTALRAVNVCHSYGSSDRAGACFLVPEVTSFHPFLSPEVAPAILLGTNPACISTAAAVWGSWSCCMSEEILCISISVLPHINFLFHFFLICGRCSCLLLWFLCYKESDEEITMRKLPTAFITRNLLFSIIFYQPEQKALEAYWNKIDCQLASGFRGKFYFPTGKTKGQHSI